MVSLDLATKRCNTPKLPMLGCWMVCKLLPVPELNEVSYLSELSDKPHYTNTWLESTKMGKSVSEKPVVISPGVKLGAPKAVPPVEPTVVNTVGVMDFK